MKKLLYTIPILSLLLMSAFAMAVNLGFSLREAPSEYRDVNFYSSGVTGSGYITDVSGIRTTYSFAQNNGMWLGRKQVGTVRHNWQPVNVNYNPTLGTLSVPQFGLSINVVSVN